MKTALPWTLQLHFFYFVGSKLSPANIWGCHESTNLLV